MNDYGPRNKKSYSYILVLIDNFKKFGWTIPLKNKYAQSITDAFSQIVETSKRKPILLDTANGKKNVIKEWKNHLHQQT